MQYRLRLSHGETKHVVTVDKTVPVREFLQLVEEKTGLPASQCQLSTGFPRRTILDLTNQEMAIEDILRNGDNVTVKSKTVRTIYLYTLLLIETDRTAHIGRVGTQ